MKLFKFIRFWLLWSLAAPFVLLYLVVACFRSGQWSLIWAKFTLIHMSLFQKFSHRTK